MLVAVIALQLQSAIAAESPDYLRDVRPILAEYCFQCHGPDGGKRQGGLRLDRRDGAMEQLESGQTAIRPGSASESELVQRIDATDSDVLMPPPETKKQLNATQKQLLRQWIEGGAPYSEHWAYVPPVRPSFPTATAPASASTSGKGKIPGWTRNAIDWFVLAKLEAADLRPAPEADRTTLIRRLSFDLNGLPPTVEEVDTFLNDDSPDAYERLVDRLLASPHYGEKMAQDWLDLARFGDSSGYQDDGDRPNSPYRDYVIDAFNDNMPFDQFTIENLAGDLLPNATLMQKVASGFNRLHRHNEEGGSDPDEFQVVYAVDRTNTTATTWMGLTFGCAQCHDHKYDPISQREFYQLYAFFNSLKGEVVISKSASPPQIRVPPPQDQQALAQLSTEIAERERQLAEIHPERRTFEAQLVELRARRESLEKSAPLALVWAEMETPRPSRILTRGDYQSPGEVVERNVPAIFPPLNSVGSHFRQSSQTSGTGSPEKDSRLRLAPDRLALARWLVSGEHPLTARVAVNRLWKQCFGAGLVRTPEDFGVRGEPPTHPELLDWLAVEYGSVSQQPGQVSQAWDTKRLLRLIVSSAAYRQSSFFSPQLRDLDPDNRWLARGARFRLSAEEIHDAVLAASGLLTRRIGGRSVYPYQPDHFYRDKEDDPGEWKWPVETGSELYRRGLYTFLRRTTPYPPYQMFDAPSRGECTVARSRTNTPLQAIVTMNDPAFVEAARVFGELIAMQAGNNDERLEFAYRSVLSRLPSVREQEVVHQLFKSARSRYERDPQTAVTAISHGKAPRSSDVDAVDVAAWTAVATALLNLDEAITRE